VSQTTGMYVSMLGKSESMFDLYVIELYGLQLWACGCGSIHK
jgi:hypothetical protein